MLNYAASFVKRKSLASKTTISPLIILSESILKLRRLQAKEKTLVRACILCMKQFKINLFSIDKRHTNLTFNFCAT